MTCRICEQPVYFHYTCKCEGVVHKKCMPEECEECEEYPVGRKPWCVYVLAVLLVISQCLIDSVPMQILPRILIILAFSSGYTLLSIAACNMEYGDKAAILPITCMVLYPIGSMFLMHFSWFTILQIYILFIQTFVVFISNGSYDQLTQLEYQGINPDNA